MAETVVLITLPKRNAIGKQLTQIPGAFNYYTLGTEGVCIIYNTNHNVE